MGTAGMPGPREHIRRYGGHVVGGILCALVATSGGLNALTFGHQLQGMLDDIRAWLDARIRESGDFGVYSFGWSHVRVRGDTAHVDLDRGALADSAAAGLLAHRSRAIARRD